jgi:K+-sensing histidine kinase KdpD
MKTPKSDRPRDEGSGLKTWFASARRANKEELIRQIDLVTKSPVVNGVLTSVSGLMAVLNEDRQVLAVNDSFLALLGIDNPSATLGLRPGEVLQCTHSRDNSAGCGTGEYCATCGAAIAIVTSLMTNKPVERKCVLTAQRGNSPEDFCFWVKATPLNLEGSQFLFLFLQDVTEQEQRSGLNRAFLHDIKNMVMGLGCTIELMSHEKMKTSPQLQDKILRLSESLVREVSIQSSFINNSYTDFSVAPNLVSVHKLICEIQDIFSNHPAAFNKTLTISEPIPSIDIVTDLPLVVRVLNNMLVNAFEATDEGGEIKLSIEERKESVVFRVWNRSVIPKEVTKRIFQRFYSTKREPGRGLGTYSMKLFGEKFLGGRIRFTTSENKGTEFSFSIPKKIPDLPDPV